MTTLTTLTTGARYLKRGDTVDPEDHRMTHRLGVARAYLRELGVEPTVVHNYPQCKLNPKGVNYGAVFAADGRNYGGCGYWSTAASCTTVWPEWVTDQMFEEAYRAADHRQNLRRYVVEAQIRERRAAEIRRKARETEARERAAYERRR